MGIEFSKSEPSKRAPVKRLIIGAAITLIMLGACATAPKTRVVDGPIVLDAPDSVVRAENPAPQPDTVVLPPAPVDPNYETVQSVPVRPIALPDCPAGTVAQSDGTCMLLN